MPRFKTIGELVLAYQSKQNEPRPSYEVSREGFIRRNKVMRWGDSTWGIEPVTGQELPGEQELDS
jgi:hypothetical protein